MYSISKSFLGSDFMIPVESYGRNFSSLPTSNYDLRITTLLLLLSIQLIVVSFATTSSSSHFLIVTIVFFSTRLPVGIMSFVSGMDQEY